LIVGVVAIPLAMAFAIANGIRPEYGESDLPKEQKQKLAPNHAVLKGNSKTKNLNVLSTTQLLKVTKKDGNEVKCYKRCFHFFGQH
jgi:hypothetical protein